MKEREDRAEELLASAQGVIRRLQLQLDVLATLSRLRRERDARHADDTLKWLEGWQARRRGYADHQVITQMLEEYRQRRLAGPPGEAGSPDLSPPARAGWREELDRFMTAEGEEKVRMLLGEPDEGVQAPDDEEAPVSAEFRARLAEFTAANDELLARLGDRPPGQHEDWCGDASLSRPDDQCTCAVTPEAQRAQNAELEALATSASVRRRLAFAGIGASQPEPPARHEARRGDDVEAWLRHWRDRLSSDCDAGRCLDCAETVDDLLEDYRQRADLGVSLSEEIP